MRKSLLFGLTLLAVASVTSVAQAGVFNRGGGCRGGRCGVDYAAQLQPGPEVAQAEATPSEVAPGDEAVAEGSQRPYRFGRLRGLFRRR